MILLKAESAFQKALALRPSAVEPRRNLGIMYFRELDMDAATDALKPAADQNDLMSLLYLGHAYHWSDQQERANAAWTQTIEIADRVLLADPANYVALTVLADAQAALNNTTQSLAALQQMQENKNQISWISYLSARVHERANDRANALKNIEQALEQNFDAHLIDRDPWLEELRKDPAYQTIRDAYLN